MHGVYSAAVGLINRSGTHLRQARPRACVYHRPSIRLPLRRPFGPQRCRLWYKPPASNVPFYACMLLVVTLLHRLAHCSSPTCGHFCHPRAPDIPGCSRAASLGAGHQRPRMVFVTPSGSSSPTSSSAATLSQATYMATFSRRRSRRLPLRQSRH
jgi:hypothetical protein